MWHNHSHQQRMKWKTDELKSFAVTHSHSISGKQDVDGVMEWKWVGCPSHQKRSIFPIIMLHFGAFKLNFKSITRTWYKDGGCV